LSFTRSRARPRLAAAIFPGRRPDFILHEPLMIDE
jgi:hypothetical protein